MPGPHRLEGNPQDIPDEARSGTSVMPAKDFREGLLDPPESLWGLTDRESVMRVRLSRATPANAGGVEVSPVVLQFPGYVLLRHPVKFVMWMEEVVIRYRRTLNKSNPALTYK